MGGPEVLVVGAGPTGLAVACGLIQHGISVRVVDRATAPATTSRANILFGRGVEVLDRLGALGELPQRAIEPGGLTTYVNGRPLVSMRLSELLSDEGPGHRGLYVSQAQIEAELRDHLSELGVTVEWDSPLVEAEEDADGITATLGDGRTIRAGWLVGCDGARSAVRKVAGIDFSGVPVIEQFLLADVHADWKHNRDEGSIFLHHDGVLMVIPMRSTGADDLWRLMANVPAERDVELDVELDDEAIIEQFRGLLSQRASVPDVRIHGADWTSVFRIHRCLAETYRHGRFLVAGDAAHTHSPVGGQGMNTGFGDAENLAWKLALVVRGRAGEPFLDTYQAERRPLAADVLRATTTNTKLLVAEDPVRRFLRDRVLAKLASVPSVQRRNAAAASQLSVSYRRGPLGGGSPFGRRPRPGDRLPDRDCVRSDGTRTRLHRELGGHWVLLVPKLGADPGTDRTDPTDPCVDAATSRLGDFLTPLVPVEPVAGDEVWLVRPDAHLAWRGRPDPDAVGRWLDDALRTGRVRR